MRPRRQEGGDADSSVNSPEYLATTSSRTGVRFLARPRRPRSNSLRRLRVLLGAYCYRKKACFLTRMLRQIGDETKAPGGKRTRVRDRRSNAGLAPSCPAADVKKWRRRESNLGSRDNHTRGSLGICRVLLSGLEVCSAPPCAGVRGCEGR